MAADFVQNWLATTPGFATPYLLAALGLMINERAGVLNLGCEGMMLVGAMDRGGRELSHRARRRRHPGRHDGGRPGRASSSALPSSSSAPIRC